MAQNRLFIKNMNKILHIGCGPNIIDGFINTDKRDLDITKPLPYKDNEIDAVVSSHVLSELAWRDLVIFSTEVLRVLKDDGVMRTCIPVIDNGYDLKWLLGWSNINLFSVDLLKQFFLKIGFYHTTECALNRTSSIHPEVIKVDNRPSESVYIEAYKSEKGIR